jgi:hypothetical protein
MQLHSSADRHKGGRQDEEYTGNFCTHNRLLFVIFRVIYKKSHKGTTKILIFETFIQEKRKDRQFFHKKLKTLAYMKNYL